MTVLIDDTLILSLLKPVAVATGYSFELFR